MCEWFLCGQFSSLNVKSIINCRSEGLLRKWLNLTCGKRTKEKFLVALLIRKMRLRLNGNWILLKEIPFRNDFWVKIYWWKKGHWDGNDDKSIFIIVRWNFLGCKIKFMLRNYSKRNWNAQRMSKRLQALKFHNHHHHRRCRDEDVLIEKSWNPVNPENECVETMLYITSHKFTSLHKPLWDRWKSFFTSHRDTCSHLFKKNLLSFPIKLEPIHEAYKWEAYMWVEWEARNECAEKIERENVDLEKTFVKDFHMRMMMMVKFQRGKLIFFLRSKVIDFDITHAFKLFH